MADSHDHASSNQFVVGIYNDDAVTLSAIDHVRGQGVRIHEVYSPYPIHGIDPKLGYKRTRLDIAAFMFGVTGLTLALTLMSMTMAVDWPMNVGGKPYASPVFIPVAFEGTVLITALGMVGTFLLRSGLGPGAQKVVFDPRASDDRFVMAVALDKNTSMTQEHLMDVLRQSGAEEVYVKEVVN